MLGPVATKQSSSTAPAPDIAIVAGRGTVFISLAKLWFILSGWGIHVIVSRVLGVERYGLYQVVTSLVSIVNAVIVTGTYQTVSKYISQEPTKAAAVRSRSLRIQILVGGSISLAFCLLAPVIADLLNDTRLTLYLRLAALITLGYSFYAVYTGYFNGLKRFLAQAGLDVTYSTLKLALIVLFVWLGWGVAGGVGGFALAVASVLAIAAIAGRGGTATGDVSARDLLRFQANLLAFTLVFNLLQKIDLILIKSLSATDVDVASRNAGYYGAAINLANITYQIIISITFVIFPLISAATFSDDRERTRSYIAKTLRYSLMVMALVATLFSANSKEVIAVVYRPEFQAAAAALSIVAFGMLLFGVLYIITTIISASGRPGVSLGIAAITLAICSGLDAVLISQIGIVGAAAGTSIAMLAGVIIGAVYLLRRFGAFVPVLSAVKIAGSAAVVAVASGLFQSGSRVLTVFQLALLSLLYIAALLFTRELSREDLMLVKRVIRS